MKTVFIFLSVILAAIARPIEDEWQSFKATFEKSYGSQADEDLRRSIFEKNVEMIDRHNKEADLNIHSFRLGINQFADLTEEEKLSKFNNKMLQTEHLKNITDIPTTEFVEDKSMHVPSSFDWRSEGKIRPVENQGQCGSCYTFSTAEVMEFAVLKNNKENVTLSRQNLLDCTYGPYNHGCGGGSPEVCFEYVKNSRGLQTSDSYPYEGRVGRCRFNKAKAVKIHIKKFIIMDVGQITDLKLKKALFKHGPIAVAIYAGNTIMMYGSGVCSPMECYNIRTANHAVLLVGYGEEGGKKYWIIKNSWGTRWGENGYIKLDQAMNCAMFNYRIVIPVTTQRNS